MQLDALPEDILTFIFSFLGFSSSPTMSLVSYSFSEIYRSNLLWKQWWDDREWLLEAGEGRETIIEGKTSTRYTSWRSNFRDRLMLEESQLQVTFLPRMLQGGRNNTGLFISDNLLECEIDSVYPTNDMTYLNLYPYDFSWLECKISVKIQKFAKHFQTTAYFELGYGNIILTHLPLMCHIAHHTLKEPLEVDDIFSLHIDKIQKKVIFKKNKKVINLEYYNDEDNGLQISINSGTQIKLIKAKYVS